MWFVLVLVVFVAVIALLVASAKKDCKAIKAAKAAIQAAVSDGTGGFEAEQLHQEKLIKTTKRKLIIKSVAIVVAVVAYIVI